MELAEIYEKLCSLKIPVAYLMFRKPQVLPFMVYYEGGTEIRGADGYNMIRITNIVIELYSDIKRPELERQIEELFRDTEIMKLADTYLDGEKMFMTSFSFETIQYIEEE